MKVRVYQLARELKIDNDALVAIIQSLGGEATDHRSAVDEGLLEKVRARIVEGKSGGKRELTRRASGVVTSASSAGTTTVVSPTPPETPRPAAPPTPVVTPVAPPPPPVEKATPVSKVVARPSEVKRAPTSAPVEQRPRPPKASKPKSGTWSGADRSSGRPPVSGSSPGRPADSRPPARQGGRGPARPAPTPQDTGDTPLGPSRTPHVGQSRGTRGYGSAAVRSLGSRQERKKKKRKGGRHIDVQAVRQNVRKTLTALDGRSKTRRRRRGGSTEDVDQVVLPIKIHEYATVGELASALEAKPTEVIAACMQLGIIANINRQLEKEEITLIMDEFGHEPEFETEYATEAVDEIEEDAGEHELTGRAPIVTVMGHVDHGKTTLLDFIRKSQVTESESGGITQHIGAYRVALPSQTIAFLDTPGHEAFTAMRARGAKITDAVVLVVAANDQVRPQTVEAINHAKAAGVPLIVAINKIDVNGANPDNVRKGLSDAGVMVESWGGKVVDVEISAKHGTNVDKLLEMILLEAELLELKSAPTRTARGAIIESRRDSGKGIVATVMVQDGTLQVGDAFVCGAQFGRVRAMVDEHGNRLTEAGPSTPVEVLGWSGVPFAGESFVVMKDEARAREIAAHRSQITRTHEHRLMKQKTSLYTLQERIQAGSLAELNVIVKADVAGSVEVLRDTLEKISHEEIQVKVIHMGVGLITEADVNLAMASGAIIVGFHTRPDNRAQQLAINEGVNIRLYQVIYEVESEIKAAMGGMLSPEQIEDVKGSAEVREVFDISKIGQIAGCMVVSGAVGRSDRAKVYRANDVVFDGTLASLKRHKDDVKEVAAGFECGIGLTNFSDLMPGDIIEAYSVSEKARTVD